VYRGVVARLLALVFVAGCTTAPEPTKPAPSPAGDATCSETMSCYEKCGGKNYACDRTCNQRATVQAQHDSAALMRCLFHHSCYDQTCVDTYCATELAICRPTIAPVSGSLVSR
jgi:hypothetical protein